MSNTCCTGMMVRTHGGSVWECMTPEQYDAFIESMNHPIPRWVFGLCVLISIIIICLISENRDPYSDRNML